MKKALPIITIVLAIGLAGIYVLHFINYGKTFATPEQIERESGEASVGSIVYIHIDSLLNEYDLFLDLQSD